VTLTQLKYFVHVATLKSFTRAAEHLYVAQSALSRQIRLLEEEVKTQLLVRHGRRLELTEAGALLLGQAGSLLKQVEELGGSVRALGGSHVGPLRIGYNPSVAELLVAPAVQELVAKYPALKIQFKEHLSEALKEDLLTDRIHVGVMTAIEPHPDLRITPLFWEPLWLLIRPGAAALKKGLANISALKGLPLIQTAMPNGIRRQIEQEAQRRGVQLNVLVECDSLYMIKTLVSRGVGAHISPMSAFKRELDEGSIAGVPLNDIRITRAVAYRGDRPLSSATVDFHEEIQRQVAKLVPRKQWL
jgi:LysR family nitrogen assimilation transcriptional regulator